jgi:hypothetical protein
MKSGTYTKIPVILAIGCDFGLPMATACDRLRPLRLRLRLCRSRHDPLEFTVLVPGGADDMGPVRGEEGCGVGQDGVGNMLLEGHRGVVVQ